MEIVGISEEFQLAESYQQYLAESGYDIDIVGVLPNSVDRLFLHYLYDISQNTDSSLANQIEYQLGVPESRRENYRKEFLTYIKAFSSENKAFPLKQPEKLHGPIEAMRLAIKKRFGQYWSPTNTHFYHEYLTELIDGRGQRYTGHHNDDEFRVRFAYGGNLIFYYNDGEMIVTADGNTYQRLNILIDNPAKNTNIFNGLERLASYIVSEKKDEIVYSVRRSGFHHRGIHIDMRQPGCLDKLKEIVDFCYKYAPGSAVKKDQAELKKDYGALWAEELPPREIKQSGFGKTQARILDLS